MIQQISRKIYRDLEVSDSMKDFTEEAWGIIESAEIKVPLPDEALPDVSKITFIRISESYINTRTRKISKLAEALSQHSQGLEVSLPVISSKYDPHIDIIDKGAAARLSEWLSKYHDAILDS